MNKNDIDEEWNRWKLEGRLPDWADKESKIGDSVAYAHNIHLLIQRLREEDEEDRKFIESIFTNPYRLTKAPRRYTKHEKTPKT